MPKLPRVVVVGLGVVAAVLSGGRDAAAAVTALFVDELGDGVLEPSAGGQIFLTANPQPDPGPEGLMDAFTYSMMLDVPFPPLLQITPGDVLIQHGAGGPVGDLIRFNPGEANC